MNQQEEQIKELYQQLKRDDERQAPSFASMLETLVTQRERAAGGWPVLRFALAALGLLLMAGGWFVFFRRSTNEQVVGPPAPPEIKIPQVPHSDPPPKMAVSDNKPPKVVKRRHAAAQRLPVELMISQWR